MTDDKQEREHCEQVSAELDSSDGYVEILLRERAAARSEGEAMGHARCTKEEVEIREYDVQCALARERAANLQCDKLQSKYDFCLGTLKSEERAHDYTRTDLRKLQSKHERLVTAARANIAEWQSYVDDPETGADYRCAYAVCIADMQADLADEPTFDQLNQSGFERMIKAADARYLRLATAARDAREAIVLLCRTDQARSVKLLDAALADEPEDAT